MNGDAFDCQQLALSKFWDVLYPTNYAINIYLDSDQFQYDPAIVNGGMPTTFPASTTITLNVNQSTTCIILHSDNLTYSQVSVQESSDSSPVEICNDITSCSTVIQPITRSSPPNSTLDSNLIAINLGNATLQPGIPAIVSFNYTGSMGANPSSLGLHHSSPFTVCTDQNDLSTCTGKVLVSSQLERVGARKVFPSYDMPSSKATFDISLTVPNEVPVVLSNMEETSRTPEEKAFSGDSSTRTVTFATTPEMSPYLVAITAGDLKDTGSTTTMRGKNGQDYEVKGWAVPGRESSMLDAQMMAGKALEYYSTYFDMDQPMKKVYREFARNVQLFVCLHIDRLID